MKSFAFAFGLLAIANAAQFTNTNYNVQKGQSFTLTWTNGSGDATILLKDGASTNLKTVKTMASGLTDTSYSFTPDWTTGEYAFEIDDDSGVNYSPQFSYQGTPAAATTADAASTMATVTSAATATTGADDSDVTSAASSAATATSAVGTAVSSAASAASGAAKTATAEGSEATNPTSTSNASGLVAPLVITILAVGIAAL